MSLIPFAYSKDKKELVDVSEVPRGLKCNCVCPSCGMRLQARQGNKNEHHFSHYDKAEVDCDYSYWVSIRDMAKQILQELSYMEIDSSSFAHLHKVPYSIDSSTIEIFGTDKRNNGFDLVLQTSIGKLNIHFLTSEDDRNDFTHEHDYFTDILVLQIDLKQIVSKKSLAKKHYMKKEIIGNDRVKQIIPPAFIFDLEEILNEIHEEPKTKNEVLQQTQEKESRRVCVSEIASSLYLDSRGLTYKQEKVISKMEEFYNKCRKKYIAVLFPEEYTICYEEDEFKYISFENVFYAIADMDGIYVIYQFNGARFIKIASSRNKNRILTLLKTSHENAIL